MGTKVIMEAKLNFIRSIGGDIMCVMGGNMKFKPIEIESGRFLYQYSVGITKYPILLPPILNYASKRTSHYTFT